MPNNEHQPVLLAEVLEVLRPTAGDSYLDLTAGYGGHAQAILNRTAQPELAVLVDRDQNAVDHLKQLFGDDPGIVKADFLSASQKLAEEGRDFDLILADLGTSSPHLDQPHRGFSFSRSGPLDMRMDESQALSADTVVNHWPEAEIADILHRYGQEPKSRKIAQAIVAARPLSNTEELAAVVKKAWPGYSRVHPATRTFQAIRMAVNDETNQLVQSLPLWLQMLKPDGRLAVISFHSGEDAIVKNFFRDQSGQRYDSQLQMLTKKPITPGENELTNNPRSRSAKLRAAAKINNRKDHAHDEGTSSQ